MSELHTFLNNILLITQVLATIIGALYFVYLKKSYWKWFSIYLIIIFTQEWFWKNNLNIDKEYRIAYYVYFGIPFQFIFFYWLYALKSLKKINLFLWSTFIYILAIVIFTFLKPLEELNSVSTNIGSIILLVLLVMEFIKQIKTDRILNFSKNKMFYINIGLILFYIGSYPYHVFGKEIYENYRNIWDVYHTYFLVSNCIMYLLFSASFIWGKTH